jgi:hypothetical protein
MNEPQKLSEEFYLCPILAERPKGQPHHNVSLIIGFKMQHMPTGTCEEFLFKDYPSLEDKRSMHSLRVRNTEFIFNEMKKMKEQNL